MKNTFIFLLVGLFLEGCNSVTAPILQPTSSSIPLVVISTPTPISVATKILVPKSTKTVVATATVFISLSVEPTSTEWLPYNPNLSDKGCSGFIATLPVKGTENLTQTDIARKLFEIFLRHAKSPELGGRCRLEDFKIEIVKADKRLDFLAKEQKVDYIRTVQYSVQIKEVPNDWVAGNGIIAPDGWIIHKFLIIGITKVNDQYVLKGIGTGP